MMNPPTVFPDRPLSGTGLMSQQFLDLGVDTFQKACRHVHRMPYGYNSNRDDRLILFKEGLGSCTTKHAVIGILAAELGLSIEKNIGIYRMTDKIVTGTDAILKKYCLPHVPMLHCFLVYNGLKVDLTEGNRNGKNCAINDFLHAETVPPMITAKAEYLLYRRALKEQILDLDDLAGTDIKQILRAREEGLALLKKNIQ